MHMWRSTGCVLHRRKKSLKARSLEVKYHENRFRENRGEDKTDACSE